MFVLGISGCNSWSPWLDPKWCISEASWSINDLKSDSFQTTAFCWTQCGKQRCYETWNMTSRQRQFLSTRNGSNWWMVKVHQMHHVGAIEKHMNITSDQLLSMLQHVCSEETSKIICPNLTLPQAGFHLMWFSDFPEYADATRRSKRKGEKPATTPQQPASGWVGVFPVSLFLFGGAHVSWVGMGWLSKND